MPFDMYGREYQTPNKKVPVRKLAEGEYVVLQASEPELFARVEHDDGGPTVEIRTLTKNGDERVALTVVPRDLLRTLSVADKITMEGQGWL